MNPIKTTTQSEIASHSFDQYCKENAISLIDVPEEKLSGVTISGTKEYKENANYLDYKIELKEGENQYFRLTNSPKIMVVKSLYVMRLNYSNSLK
jgi:hypothetical protein